MAFVPVPQVAEFRLNQRLFDQQLQNTLYGQYGADPDSTSLLITAQSLAGWWQANIAPELSVDHSLVEVSARLLTTENSAIASFQPATPIQGSVANPANPGNVALVASFRTGLAGRSFRGRNYIGGIPENATVGNEVSGTFRAAIAAAYDILITPGGPFGGEGAFWVVVSREANKLPRPTGVATRVLSVIVNETLDSQRRRLTGRGR